MYKGNGRQHGATSNLADFTQNLKDILVVLLFFWASGFCSSPAGSSSYHSLRHGKTPCSQGDNHSLTAPNLPMMYHLVLILPIAQGLATLVQYQKIANVCLISPKE